MATHLLNSPTGLEIGKLLAKYNAKLIRQKTHLVYELPNGRHVTLSKTPKGEQTRQNELRNVKREVAFLKKLEDADGNVNPASVGANPLEPMLAVPFEPGAPAPVQPEPEPEPVVQVLAEAAEPVVGPEPDPEPEPPQPTLLDRINSAIDLARAEAEDLSARAIEAENRATLLAGLLPLAKQSWAEAMLLSLLPQTAPVQVAPVEAPPAPPEPEPADTSVTRDGVLAYCRSRVGVITSSEVYDAFAVGKRLSPDIRRRMSQGISHNLAVLEERGYLLKISPGRGRKPATYQNAQPAAGGVSPDGVAKPNGVGVH